MKIIKVGIIGFGNIGKKRFDALRNLRDPNISILFICEKKKIEIKNKKIKIYKNWEKAIKNKIDLLFICTPTIISEKIVKKVIGKFHLMVEKPISKNLAFTKRITKFSLAKRKILKTGYNLRFDEGLKYVKNLLEKKKLGKIYHCKITYANGTALTNTNQVGSLFDMGAHSLNLIEWFFPKKVVIKKSLIQKNEFLKRKITDNGFINLKTDDILINIHHGFCNWKNQFNVEIIGKKGYLIVDSLPKWNIQTVSFGKRTYPSGMPKIRVKKFNIDKSWMNEIKFLIKNLRSINNIDSINKEGLKTLQLIKKIEKNV